MTGENRPGRDLRPGHVILLCVALSVIASAVTSLVFLTANPGSKNEPPGLSTVPETPAEKSGISGPELDSTPPADRRLEGAVERNARDIAWIKKRLEKAPRPAVIEAAGNPPVTKEEILERLKRISPDDGQFALRAALAELIKLGDKAVPDIVALLKTGFERSYGGGYSIRGGRITDYASLRMAFIDVLRQINTPTARRGILGMLAASSSVTDFRDVLLVFQGTKDGELVKGISSLVPDCLRRLKDSGLNLKKSKQLMLLRSFGEWICKHGVAESVPALVELAEGIPSERRPDPGIFSALVELAPDRAYAIAQKRLDMGDADKSFGNLLLSLRMNRHLSLSKATDFFERLLWRTDLTPGMQRRIYSSIPSRLCTRIENKALRAVDGKRMLDFLNGRLNIETDKANRKLIERKINSLKHDIERSEKL